MARKEFRPYVVRLAQLAALAVLVCSSDGCRREQPSVQDIYAARKTRPVALRLSGLPYLPAPSPNRKSSTADVDIAATAHVALTSANSDTPTRALALFLLNKPGEAVETLRARAQTKPSAPAWSDLAAALEHNARADANPRTTAQALAAADRALRLDARLPEAHFNRAAILQRMGWRDAAVRAWERYLALDPNSPWANEARTHLSLLHAPTDFKQWPAARTQLEQAAASGRTDEVVRIVRAFPQLVRTTAEGEDLANWGTAWREGDRPRAQKILQKVQSIAQALIAVNDEHLLHDSAEAAAMHPDVLSRAHIQYREARILIARRKITDALPAIVRAEEMFRSGNSPMALVARYYRAGVLFDLNRADEASTLLDSIEDRAASNFQALRAQVLWEKSFRMLRRGEGYASLAPNAASLALFERLGERDNSIRLLANRVATLTLLGRDEEASRMRARLFVLAGQSGRPDTVESVLHTSGFTAVQEQQYDVAYSLFSLLFDSEAQSPVRRFDAALFRAMAAARIGIGSPNDLRDLESAAEAVPDETLREDCRDEIRYMTALSRQRRDPDGAIALLSRCIEHRQQKQLWTLAETFASRGETYRLKGDAASAMTDFERALSLLEDERARIDEDPVRDSFFASANTICLSLADLQVSRGENGKSFATFERCRARVLADVLSDRRRDAATDIDRVRAALDRSTTLLHYTVLENRIVVFIVRRDGLATRAIDVPRNEVEAAVARIVSAANRNDRGPFENAMQRMQALLLHPIASSFPATDALVIVPDEILAPTPFAALRSPNGRYLIEEHDLLVAPSATSYAKSVSTAPQPQGASRVTVVADPAFDRAVAGELERLSAARREAQDLRTLYPNATVLMDSDATPHRFLQAVALSELVHVGSHAIVSSRDATQSALVLAADDRGGLLSLGDIRAQKLQRHPIVVLAGCKSAIDGAGKGSVRNLAFAFLSAGARGVVGSVWNVDDSTTYALSTAFHRALRDGLPAAKALRAAQLHMLRSTNPAQRSVQAWGAFQYYGFKAAPMRRSDDAYAECLLLGFDLSCEQARRRWQR